MNIFPDEPATTRRGLAGYARSGASAAAKVIVLGLLLPLWVTSEIRQASWSRRAKAGALGGAWLLTLAAVGAALPSGNVSSQIAPQTTPRVPQPTAAAASPTPQAVPHPEPGTGALATDSNIPGPPDGAVAARVLRVIDGDTVVLSTIGVGARDNQTGGHRARLIGIDTPEVHGGTDCYGPEASAFAKAELDGRDVMVDFDVQRTDRYGRALVYIWTTDAAFFNARLAAEGYAQQATFPPNVRYVDLFRRLVREAREAGRGLWSGCPAANAAPPAVPAAPAAPAPAATTSDGPLGVSFTSVTSPVPPRGSATATVATAPGAQCTITVTYKSGPSKAQGLEPKTAGAQGSVSWTWTVGSNTTPGDWPIDVSCTSGDARGSAGTHFTVG